MVNNENIKSFAQRILGCGCPEEVFQYIDCQCDIEIDNLIVKNRINIGNRLLIYVVEVKKADSLSRILPLLFDAGKNDRESSGLNRFRLVLAADIVDDIKKAAEEIFKKINKDEKIHLHVILNKTLPDFNN
jgi:hypothetical protein